MKFEDDDSFKNIGRETGFFLGYVLFFSVFYFLLRITGKIPYQIEYIPFILLIIAPYLLVKIGRKVIAHEKG